MKGVLIGVGAWGKNHARALAELGALGAVYDVNRQAALSAAEEFGCASLNGLSGEELKGYDFAVVATPASIHVDVALKLVELGLDVLVEKPISTSYGEALKLVEEARRRGRIIGVGYIELFNPVVKRLIEESGKGGPFSASAYRLNYRPSRISDVGVVLDTMIHDINIANVILSGSRLSSSHVAYDGQGVDVFARAYIEGDGGSGVSITAGWTSGLRFRRWIVASGDSVLDADLISRGLTIRGGGAERTESYEGANALLEEDRHFIESVKERREPINGAGVALKDMLIAGEILGGKR